MTALVIGWFLFLALILMANSGQQQIVFTLIWGVLLAGVVWSVVQLIGSWL